MRQKSSSTADPTATSVAANNVAFNDDAQTEALLAATASIGGTTASTVSCVVCDCFVLFDDCDRCRLDWWWHTICDVNE